MELVYYQQYFSFNLYVPKFRNHFVFFRVSWGETHCTYFFVFMSHCVVPFLSAFCTLNILRLIILCSITLFLHHNGIFCHLIAVKSNGNIFLNKNTLKNWNKRNFSLQVLKSCFNSRQRKSAALIGTRTEYTKVKCCTKSAFLDQQRRPFVASISRKVGPRKWSSSINRRRF